MKYLNLFIPNFLQDIDNRLMLQMPHIWRTRIHFVAFYGLIAWILLFFIGLFYPLSMYDISRTPYAVEEVKRVSFLFLLICGFFSLIYWWQQVAKFRILAAKWYHSFMECALFFVGIFMLWQAVNAFQNGLNTNMAYRVGRSISAADREKLYLNNFYLPGFISYESDDQFRSTRLVDITEDSFYNAYYPEAEKVLQAYHKSILRGGIGLDSQFFVRKELRYNNVRYRNEDEDFYYPTRYYGSGVYELWKDSINMKARKYIKPYPQLENIWNKRKKKYEDKWIVMDFNSDNYWLLDSAYQLFNAYDKYQVDSVKNEYINSAVDEQRKKQDFALPLLFNSLRRSDIAKVLDTCSSVFFNNQQWTFLDLLKLQSQKFEQNFRQKQVFLAFTPDEREKYRGYLLEMMQLMPINNRMPLKKMEVGLYYRRDSLAIGFLNNLSPRSKKIYEDLIAFYINNSIEKNEAATNSGNFKWNKQTRKYSEIEKMPTKGFLDTVFFYTDSILSAKFKQKYAFDKVYNLINNYKVSHIQREIEEWYESKDTFLFVTEFRNKDREKYIVTKKMRRDSIPIDTVYKWKIENFLGHGVEQELENTSLNRYKKYRDSKISTEDSIFLDNVYTRCGYLRDSSEHSRLFFHANAYYLYLADITINKSRAFLTGWNPLYLSTSHKLAIIVLSFLMFFTTLANSNLFTAVFVAFFINFVNNTIFNLGQNFQEIDKSKQTFWLFGLLAILALLTAVNVLFRKFKLPIIYLLINIQLFALLGIFVWLFDSQTIEQQSNYGYLAIIFLGLMVWKYRSYLALPSKK